MYLFPTYLMGKNLRQIMMIYADKNKSGSYGLSRTVNLLQKPRVYL